MRRFWILGGGRYGRIALQAVCELGGAGQLTVVDNDPAVCRRLKRAGYPALCMDGIDFLAASLGQDDASVWIIPVIPLHTAFKWLCRKLRGRYALQALPVDDGQLKVFPNPMRGELGEVYSSYADFRCPEHCAEPAAVCTATGRRRAESLFERLAHAPLAPFVSIVLRSRQLAPGVGGYRASELLALHGRIVAAAGSPILLSTACRCHAVSQAFRLLPEAGGSDCASL